MELNISKLCKDYKTCKALNNVSFSVHSGEVVGLLGHNGAGKSTLIKCIMNAIKSYSGCISIDGKDLRRNQELLSRECSFLLEPSFCDYLSAKKNLELLNCIVDLKSQQSVDEILSLVSLGKRREKKVAEFSFGMKQRLGLAQTFLSKPHFVILDEPTVGLDPVGIDIIKNIIRELSKNGVSVLFSSHQIIVINLAVIVVMRILSGVTILQRWLPSAIGDATALFRLTGRDLVYRGLEGVMVLGVYTITLFIVGVLMYKKMDLVR